MDNTLMWGLALLLVITPLLAQHDRGSSDSRHPSFGNPEAVAAGAKLFTRSCGGCHGPDGSGGRGPSLVRRARWPGLGDEAVSQMIRKGIPGTDMPPTNLTEEQAWQVLAFLHSLAGPASKSQVPGNPTAGGDVFWGSKAGCSVCHAIRGKGGRLGPDLTDAGGSRSLAAIREAILQPSAELSYLGNEAVTVTLKNGKVFQGVARNRSNYSLQLLDAQGALHLIKMSEVRQLALSEGSLMPGDYANRLSGQELQDLLAYLAQQKSREE